MNVYTFDTWFDWGTIELIRDYDMNTCTVGKLNKAICAALRIELGIATSYFSTVTDLSCDDKLISELYQHGDDFRKAMMIYGYINTMVTIGATKWPCWFLLQSIIDCIFCK